MRVALACRGHVRDGFDTVTLRNLLRTCRQELGDTDVYVHTWSTKDTKLEYRPTNDMERSRSNIHVTEQTIVDYFQEQPTWLQIDHDKDAIVHGKTTGVIPSTICNRLPWKRMWFGKVQVARAVAHAEVHYDVIITVRIDLFTRLESPPSINHICNVAMQAHKHGRVEFLSPHYVHGIDNCYCNGSASQWCQDVEHFFYNVDEIADRRHGVRFQERLVYEEMQNVVARSEVPPPRHHHLSGTTWNTRKGWKGPEEFVLPGRTGD